MIVEAGALRGVESALHAHFAVPRAPLVADENTCRAAARVVRAQLESAGGLAAVPLIFPGAPRLHPEFDYVLRIEAFLVRPTTARPWRSARAWSMTW